MTYPCRHKLIITLYCYNPQKTKLVLDESYPRLDIENHLNLVQPNTNFDSLGIKIPH
jgi:hypothetical protein